VTKSAGTPAPSGSFPAFSPKGRYITRHGLAQIGGAGRRCRGLRAELELGTTHATWLDVMPHPWHHPLSTFCEAAESAVGWLLVMVGTSVFGLWLGMWIGSWKLPGVETMVYLPWLPLRVIASFPYLPFVTALLWYVPHRYESLRLRLGAALVNWLAWVGCSALAFWWHPWRP